MLHTKISVAHQDTRSRQQIKRSARDFNQLDQDPGAKMNPRWNSQEQETLHGRRTQHFLFIDTQKLISQLHGARPDLYPTRAETKSYSGFMERTTQIRKCIFIQLGLKWTLHRHILVLVFQSSSQKTVWFSREIKNRLTANSLLTP